VRIGKPISVAEQNEYKTTEPILNSEKTYMLANPYEKESKLLTATFKIPEAQRNRYSC
jgi:hypothetical protein